MADFIAVVSGLPRSGTSMMMQMIDAGGLPALTDNVRQADDDNPKGYYELEKVKRIKEDSTWLANCRGKVFKMVSMLLFDLPPDYSYRIVFMKRDLGQVLASQRIMLRRMDKEPPPEDDSRLLEMYRKHLFMVESWLKKQPNIQTVFVRYDDVVAAPGFQAARVNDFLGGTLDTKKMAGAVERALFRQRCGTTV